MIMALATNALKDVMARRDLSRETTEQLFGELMDGQLSPVVKSALLAALATKGEAASEIAGAATAGWLLYLRSHWLRMPPLLLMRHLWIKSRRKDSRKEQATV